MQNAGLGALGLAGEYRAYDVAPADLPAFVAGARARGLRGLNVTIPHKEAALALCQPDELARRVGAVNTLVFDADATRGGNTDVHGFERLLAVAGAPGSGRVVVLGAGGAARAVIAALAGRARELVLVSRRAEPLVIDGRAWPGTPWNRLFDALYEAELLVDTTPRGLDAQAAPIDLAPLPAHAVVVDLVVARETRLTADARARNLRAATGVEMLLHQGARALELWTGRPAPLDAMREALVAAL
jgi:shikimate dehydrogenase